MSLFSFEPDRALTGLATQEAASLARGARGEGDAGFDAFNRVSRFERDDGSTASRDDLLDQFIVYQISREPEGPALLDTTAVAPSLSGSEEQPDVLARLNLVSFHIGQGEGIEPDTRATMRITFGRDPSSASRILDTAFWAAAAGLKLHSEGKVAQDKQLAADLNRAFANRPVEVPGGLGLLSFEVVKHEEPAWWRTLFDFAGSGTGRALSTVLGFPAITQSALALVDQLLGRLAEDRHEVLFKSAPMRLALTQQAHDEFTGGSARIKLGSLADGYCVLARGRDRQAFMDADAVFHPTFGLLAPASADAANMGALTSDNPLHGLTYAVFRVKMKSAQLDPDFSFR